MEPASPTEAQRLHPMTLVQRFVMSLPGYVVLLWPLLRNPDAASWFTVLFAVGFGALTLPLIFLQYLRFRYWITPQEIIIHSGVLTRRRRNIPIERVQNIEVEQPLLPRLLGMAKVKIVTAGSTAAEGVMEFVSIEEAHRIREVVRTYQRQTDPAAAPAPPPTRTSSDAAALQSEASTITGYEERRTLFEMPVSRVLLSGVFRFSLLYIALMFSGLQYFNVDPEKIVDWVTRGVLAPLSDVAQTSPWLLASVSVVAAALLAWLTGILVNLNKYYRFSLQLEKGKLQRRSGLLTVSEGTIPLKRIQTLIVVSNPFMRRFGWYRLELQTMGLDVQERGHQVAVPFAQGEEILRQAAYFFPFTPPEVFHSVSPLTIRRTLVRYTFALVVAVGPVAYFLPMAWWGLLAWPLLAGWAVLQFRRHGYLLAEDALYVRRGVLRQHLWVVPIQKFQVFYATASLFQRRLGLKSVLVDTAGAGGFAYPVVVDLPDEAADALMASLYARFQQHFAPKNTEEER